MYFEQFYLGCLSHASYMLGSEGEAVVVDPQRDVDIYLQAAREQGLKIRHIRSIGLREGESFSDSQPMNNNQFTFTIVPRIITKTDATKLPAILTKTWKKMSPRAHAHALRLDLPPSVRQHLP